LACQIYQTAPHWAAVVFQHSPRDADPLPQWPALVLAGQIVIQLTYRVATEGGTGGFREGLGERSGFFDALRRVAT